MHRSHKPYASCAIPVRSPAFQRPVGGVLLNRRDAFLGARLGFVSLTCSDDFAVAGFESEPEVDP